MQETIRTISDAIALGCEVAAVGVLTYGALEGLFGLLRIFRNPAHLRVRRHVWLRFAGWILLGLEFTLAADIIRSTIDRTWDTIGQLAAIAVIRTALNFFLERDMESFAREQREEATLAADPAATSA